MRPTPLIQESYIKKNIFVYTPAHSICIWKVHIFLRKTFNWNTMDLIVIHGQEVFLHTITLTKGLKRNISFTVMGGVFTFTGSSQEVLT